jgi:hypothetical protein
MLGTGYLGNCHLLPIFVSEKVQKYDHYWFMEYDIIYTGNWEDIFFTSTQEDTSDLIAEWLESYMDSQEPSLWHWWKHENIAIQNLAKDKIMK